MDANNNYRYPTYQTTESYEPSQAVYPFAIPNPEIKYEELTQELKTTEVSG